MNLNSFKRNRKALTALLICTGFITTHPLAAFAGDNVPAVQMVQQQKQSVSGIVKDSTGEPIIGCGTWCTQSDYRTALAILLMYWGMAL